MIKEFKEFIMRGNVIDMAVGIVIGAAFTAVVTGVVSGIITPIVNLIIALATGSTKGEFDGLNVRFHGVEFKFGDVVTALLSFLITAFVLFLIVKGTNKLKDMAAKKKAEEPAAAPEITLLEDIRDLLEKQQNPAAAEKSAQKPARPDNRS
ncbi:MAG: large conductance mechanosensitive channel protein MscL [Enterococcaceae bacterium]|jgi:large conductance mechanosensitive channel|nr:large conductance mechanosensitive channel protein MscL [Enterococcaceae bacterium]MCI1919717.1 large conductance mechanosensitive channel protein MscL [Enterococcaceae bacterium]